MKNKYFSAIWVILRNCRICSVGTELVLHEGSSPFCVSVPVGNNHKSPFRGFDARPRQEEYVPRRFRELRKKYLYHRNEKKKN